MPIRIWSCTRTLSPSRAGGQSVELTKQEFKILELLLSNPERVFSKQDIYDYAWDDLYIGEDKTINVHISNIRKKLKAVSGTEYIETVWASAFALLHNFTFSLPFLCAFLAVAR